MSKYFIIIITFSAISLSGCISYSERMNINREFARDICQGEDKIAEFEYKQRNPFFGILNLLSFGAYEYYNAPKYLKISCKK